MTLTKIPSIARCGILSALFCCLCLSTEVHALGISTCNPAIDLCVMIITDGTIAKNTQILSTLSYDINAVHSQSPTHYDWLSPNTNYYAASLPVDLLSKAQIKNLSYTISEINRMPISHCGVKTAPGKVITAGTLTIFLFFNSATHSMNCVASNSITN